MLLNVLSTKLNYMNICFEGFGFPPFNANISEYDFLIDALLCNCGNVK
jgi:hypothetical protein